MTANKGRDRKKRIDENGGILYNENIQRKYTKIKEVPYEKKT